MDGNDIPFPDLDAFCDLIAECRVNREAFVVLENQVNHLSASEVEKRFDSNLEEILLKRRPEGLIRSDDDDLFRANPKLQRFTYLQRLGRLNIEHDRPCPTF